MRVARSFSFMQLNTLWAHSVWEFVCFNPWKVSYPIIVFCGWIPSFISPDFYFCNSCSLNICFVGVNLEFFFFTLFFHFLSLSFCSIFIFIFRVPLLWPSLPFLHFPCRGVILSYEYLVAVVNGILCFFSPQRCGVFIISLRMLIIILLFAFSHFLQVNHFFIYPWFLAKLSF